MDNPFPYIYCCLAKDQAMAVISNHIQAYSKKQKRTL